MFRFSDASRCILPAFAVVFVLLAMAALAPPLAAQERGAAAQDDDDDKAVEVDDDEDDLLEPSNTGYIDDAVVGSKIRLRLDSAFNASKPDRAEFIYGKCTCFAILFGQDAASPGPAADLDFQEFELYFERAVNRRFSIFLELPFRSVDLTLGGPFAGQVVDQKGPGDLRAGFKYALVAEDDRYVTFQLRGYFPTGDAGESLGTDHPSIEPGLLYFNRPKDRVTVISELRLWYPLSGSSDPLTGASGRIAGFEPIRSEGGALMPVPPSPPDPPVRNDGYTGEILRFGLGVGYEGRGSRITVSPVAELVGWHVFGGYAFTGELFDADGDTIVNLKLGARFSAGGSDSFYIGYGFPLSSEDWYGGILRAEYRIGYTGASRRQREEAAARAAAEEAAAQRAEARAAAARAEAEAERAAAAKAAREAETERKAAAKAARETEEKRAAAEKAAHEAEAKRAQAETALAAAGPGHRVARSVAPCLNLRPEPTLESTPANCLVPGLRIKVLEKGEEWSRVELATGRRGWVASRYLEPLGP